MAVSFASLLALVGALSAPPDVAARDILQRAVDALSHQREWSASVTMEATNEFPRSVPGTLVRQGKIHAAAPNTFELSLAGVSDATRRSRQSNASSVDFDDVFGDSWRSVIADGKNIRGVRIDDFEMTSSYNQSIEMHLVGNIPPLMFWLDRSLLSRFLNGKFNLSYKGIVEVAGVKCDIVNVLEPPDGKSYVRQIAQSDNSGPITLRSGMNGNRTDALKNITGLITLYIDSTGQIYRTTFKSGSYRSAVTLSNVVSTRSKDPLAPPTRDNSSPVGPLSVSPEMLIYWSTGDR